MLPLAILLTLICCALSLRVLIKHRRNVAHHRACMPVIGRHAQLTEVLHERLTARQPQRDWLNPANLQAKCAAWQRQTQENIQH